MAEKIRKVEGVAAASPYIFTQMMISSGAAPSGRAARRGHRHDRDVTRLSRDIRVGRLSDLRRKTGESLPGVILGRELAANLGVGPGEVVEVLVPGGPSRLWGVPRTARFQVVGISESGMYEYDATFAYISSRRLPCSSGWRGAPRAWR